MNYLLAGLIGIIGGSGFYTMPGLENARWELEQTVYRAPSDGRVVNLQVRVGTMLVPLAVRSAPIRYRL